jgi:hypothetical protein
MRSDVIVAVGRLRIMRYATRRPAAVLAIAVLAAITVFCPSLLCAQPDINAAGHSCCPRSQHKPGPLPCDAASHACPYTLLEKAKSAALPLAVLPPVVKAIAAPMERCEPIAACSASVLPAEDLYLRNRVLLL